MVNESLSVPLDDQAKRRLEYWRIRIRPAANGRPIDPSMQRQWDAVLAGTPIEGNCSYFQQLYPEPATSPGTAP